MKTIFTAALLAVTALAPLKAAAETLDIATLKCSDVATMKPEEVALVLAWIDGYLGGQADDTRLDLDRFNANADAAAEACAAEPATGLLTVLKQAESGN
ncbi:HdeA/HdeB family chaperone [Aestuariivirga sp.]|uniref:HdeA/HdeB family chaperone n=1 Tax=Aestuariivirga sp. TaxID=2650926 RepID=UPI0025C04794|nr:HdeA/HdeB family chaperone [Aestuariivirga sp.]MCA3556563.1 hypothetical protein [Aestuariivirga sp.]